MRPRVRAGEPFEAVQVLDHPVSVERGIDLARPGSEEDPRERDDAPEEARALLLAEPVEDARAPVPPGHDAAARLVLDHDAEARDLVVVLHEVHEPLPDKGHLRREEVDRERGSEHEDPLAPLELVHAVALGDRGVPSYVLVHERAHGGRRVDREVLPELGEAPREVVAPEDDRSRERPAREHDRARPDRDLPLARARLEANGATLLHEDALGTDTRPELGAAAERRGDVGDVRAPPGVRRAAEVADPRAVAAGRVPPHGLVGVAEDLAPAGYDPCRAAQVLPVRLGDLYLALDALEVRSHAVGRELLEPALDPALEHPARSAPAGAGVDGGRAAHELPRRDRDDDVPDRAEEPA